MVFIKFGVRQLKTLHFWASCLAECLATCFFVFLTTGTTITWKTPPSTELIALSFGLSIATLAMATLHLSGGHINPAVSIAMLATGKVPILRGCFYVIFQLGGGRGFCVILYLVVMLTLLPQVVHLCKLAGLSLHYPRLLFSWVLFGCWSGCLSCRTCLLPNVSLVQ